MKGQDQRWTKAYIVGEFDNLVKSKISKQLLNKSVFAQASIIQQTKLMILSSLASVEDIKIMLSHYFLKFIN